MEATKWAMRWPQWTGARTLWSPTSRPDGGNEMGNALATVDWGTDFVVADISTGWRQRNGQCAGHSGLGHGLCGRRHLDRMEATKWAMRWPQWTGARTLWSP